VCKAFNCIILYGRYAANIYSYQWGDRMMVLAEQCNVHAIKNLGTYWAAQTAVLRYYWRVNDAPDTRPGPDLSVWRPWAGSLLEAPTHPQML